MKKSILFSLCLLLAMNVVGWAGPITDSPDLPPIGPGIGYECEDISALGISITEGFLSGFSGVVRSYSLGDEFETFNAVLTANTNYGALTMTGPVQNVAFSKSAGATGTYSTEMASMSLSGSVGIYNVLLRESPSLASDGQTTITDLGGGLYEIESFFDVWIELSMDGGASWTPNGSAAKMTISPEPATLCLLGLGGLLLRRRKSA